MPEYRASGNVEDVARMIEDVRKDLLDQGGRADESLKKSGVNMRNESWTAEFFVAASSHHFKLHINNRRPASGQPSVAIVDIGR